MKLHREIIAINYWMKILKLIITLCILFLRETPITIGELGLMNLWIHQDTYNITFETIKLRILDTFRQSWIQIQIIQHVFLPTLYTRMSSNLKNIQNMYRLTNFAYRHTT